MYLTRHRMSDAPRWAVAGRFLPVHFGLSLLLELPAAALSGAVAALATGESAEGGLLAPVDPAQEVWASGVTYLRSRDARQAESSAGDVYQRVYEAERPELFFKSVGARVMGHGQAVRIRHDSRWDVPEPELTLVVNRHQEIVGYCAGNDMSSRSIEGENPLYLPQAKTYTGSCALGPGIQLCGPDDMRDLAVRLEIMRDGTLAFQGETSIARMKRRLEELVAYLYRELRFPSGVLLMTGTGIVPPDSFTLQPGDQVAVTVGALRLENPVQE